MTTVLLRAKGFANVSNGDSEIIITGGTQDFSRVTSGTIVQINSGEFVEVIKGSIVDGNGHSTLTLYEPWAASTVVNGDLMGFFTFDGYRASTERVEIAGERLEAFTLKWKELLESTDPTVTVETGLNTSFTTVPYEFLKGEMQDLLDQANNLVGSMLVQSKPGFDANVAATKRLNNGSGWHNPKIETIDTGLTPNTFTILGNAVDINGITHTFNDMDITGPDAPDGLQHKDLTSPDFANIAAAVVSGGTGLDDSYLNGRWIFIPAQELIDNVDNSNNYLTNYGNNIYPDNGALKEWKFVKIIERVPESARGDKVEDLMSDLGWTRDPVDIGLWRKGVYEACAPILIQQRNKLAGHPLNPGGCAQLGKSSGITSRAAWHSPGALQPRSLSDCDAMKTTNGLGQGSILAGNVNRYNDDGKFYDEVSEGDITNLRLGVRTPTDAELLYRESRKDIAAKSRGMTGVPTSYSFMTGGVGGNSEVGGFGLYAHQGHLDAGQLFFYPNDYVDGSVETYVVGHHVTIITTTGRVVRGVIVTRNDGANYVELSISSFGGDATLSALGLTGAGGSEGGSHVGAQASVYYLSESKSAQPVVTEIIGAPADIVTMMGNMGLNKLQGVWNPTIPASVSIEVEFKYKSLSTSIPHQSTADGGVTWSSSAVSMDSTRNSVTQAPATGTVSIYHYKTLANPFVDGVNSPVDGKLGDVFASAKFMPTKGAHLLNSLLGIIVKSDKNEDDSISIPLSQYSISGHTGILAIGTSDNNQPEHAPIICGQPGNNSAMGKALPYITTIDGYKCINWVAKEMFWDVDLDWGHEFEDKAGSDFTTTVVGTYYHVTSGINAGYWYCIAGNSLPFDNVYWSEVNGYLIWEQGAAYYKRWNGTGFGDNSKFTVLLSGSALIDDLNGNKVRVSIMSRRTNYLA